MKNRAESNRVELGKSKTHTLATAIKYVPNGVLNRPILKRTTGYVTISSFDAGEGVSESLSRFDNFIQIIEGVAEVIIDKNIYKLNPGEAIVIPANTRQSFRAKQQCKIISTIIKSGYED